MVVFGGKGSFDCARLRLTSLRMTGFYGWTSTSRVVASALLCGLYEGFENRTGEGVVVDGTFGVPLHGENEVIGRGSFDGFGDLVFGAARDDAQAFSDFVDRLMVAGVDRHTLEGGRVVVRHSCQLGIGIDLHGVGDGDGASGCMVDARLDVLNQRSTTMDVQDLQAVANPEQRLARVVGITQE